MTSRNVGAPGQDTPGVSLQPVSGDSPDREPGESSGPHERAPLRSPCSRAPVPFIELLSLSLPLPRLSSQALTSVLVMFPSSVDYISHHPMSSFPRTLSEYMANQPP